MVLSQKEEKTELMLIKQIKRGDKASFVLLKERYTALTTFILAKYYLRTFDQADWQQEAAEILYRAVLEFKEEKGCFAAFYKCKLKNHIYGRLRFYCAKRRKGDLSAASLEALTEKNVVNQACTCQEEGSGYIVDKEALRHLLATFSHVELLAFEVMLGQQTASEIAEKWGYSCQQLQRAKNRAQRKLQRADLML